jgi:hypothetical protein
LWERDNINFASTHFGFEISEIIYVNFRKMLRIYYGGRVCYFNGFEPVLSDVPKLLLPVHTDVTSLLPVYTEATFLSHTPLLDDVNDLRQELCHYHDKWRNAEYVYFNSLGLFRCKPDFVLVLVEVVVVVMVVVEFVAVVMLESVIPLLVLVPLVLLLVLLSILLLVLLLLVLPLIIKLLQITLLPMKIIISTLFLILL